VVSHESCDVSLTFSLCLHHLLSVIHLVPASLQVVTIVKDDFDSDYYETGLQLSGLNDWPVSCFNCKE
jgi:hypothetical protein